MLSTIARTLDIPEQPGRAVEASVQAALADRALLLVLDNVEHLLSAANAVADLLAACARLKVLATSREALHVRGEHEWIVRPLGLPNLDRLPVHLALPRYGAVALFRQAVLARRPGFEITPASARAVAEICVRLDGLPLALELAAARCRHLALDALLTRLARPLDVLTGGPRDAPARQQTLRDAIAWSYDLLSTEEQALFRRLGVFAGGCTVDAVERVGRRETGGGRNTAASAPDSRLPTPDSVLDGLASLADKSLVEWEAGDDATDPDTGGAGPRVRMLETIREFALERLVAAGEKEEAERAHAAFFLALAEAARHDLDGLRQGTALDRLEAESDNLRAALGWSLARPDSRLALRLVGALWRFWRVRGHLAEGRAWLERALAIAREDDPTAEAFLGASKLATAQGDLAAGIRLAEASLDRARGEPAPAAAALGALAIYQGRLDDAICLNDEWGIADCLNRQGLVAYLRHDYAGAQPLLEASADRFRRIGDRRVAAVVTGNLGVVMLNLRDLDRAIEFYEESIAISRQIGDRGQSILNLSNLGDAWRRKGDYARGAELAAESLRLAGEVGDKRAAAHALQTLGLARRDSGDAVRALSDLAEGMRLFEAIGDRIGLTGSLEAVAVFAASAGQPELGARILGAVDGQREERGAPIQWWEAEPYANAEASVRLVLDGAAFQAAWSTGRATVDETVAAAIAFAAAPPAE